MKAMNSKIDPSRMGARQLRDEIAADRLTAAAVAQACLERVAEREPVIGAWAHLDRDKVLAAAGALDLATRREPLHGIPIGVKDLIDTVDLSTEYGSPIYRGHRPDADAAAVALARAAGALVLGKTVTTEFATYHPGKTANPHDPARTPGGSSSGSAAAVADRMVPLAFGTQTAGSVIRPAAFCGVVGFKPSFGTIPRAGAKLLADSLDTIGVMARSVDDVALFSAILSGRPEFDRPAVPGAPIIGLCPTLPGAAPPSDATLRLIEAAARQAEARGATLRPLRLPAGFERLVEAHKTVMAYEAAGALAYERLVRGADLSPALAALLDEGAAIDAARYDAARDDATRIGAALAGTLAELDAVLAPAAADEAPLGLGATGDPVFCRSWTLLHLPCLTLPAGRGPHDMPIGVQLIAGPRCDARLLATARFVEAALS
jgi:amidase